MIDSLFKLRYITHGLYEWGRGYVSNDVADKWREFMDCHQAGVKRRMLPYCIYMFVLLSTSDERTTNPRQ